MKNKRKSRVLALQVMYAFDVGGDTDVARLFDTIADNSRNGEETISYARMLVMKASEESESIDALLQKHIQNWDIKRMAVIDRNILRLAVTELHYFKEVPFKVIIDESVEVAKIYGADDSAKFVNGVIDAVYKELSKE